MVVNPVPAFFHLNAFHHSPKSRGDMAQPGARRASAGLFSCGAAVALALTVACGVALLSVQHGGAVLLGVPHTVSFRCPPPTCAQALAVSAVSRHAHLT